MADDRVADRDALTILLTDLRCVPMDDDTLTPERIRAMRTEFLEKNPRGTPLLRVDDVHAQDFIDQFDEVLTDEQKSTRYREGTKALKSVMGVRLEFGADRLEMVDASKR